MSIPEYDAIIIGAGHMGLTLGAYLQRSGLKTAIFERRHEEGSAIYTSECTAPGFLHNMHAQYMEFLDWMPAWTDFDLPSLAGEGENSQYNTRLDHGPAIYLADSSTLADPRLVRHLVKTAEKAEIPYQFRQPGGGGTDAGAIHRAQAGVPSVSVSTPSRYLHTAAGITRLSDWKNTLALLYKALSTLPQDIFAVER